jgi:hypothetical protein
MYNSINNTNKMKKRTKFATIFLFALLALSLSSCKKCKNEQPGARIINNGTQNASVQIQTSNGNTVNINNVDPGTSSSYSNYAAGQVKFTLKINGVDYEETVQLSNCFYYDIAIDSNNNITTVAIDRN